MLVRKNSYSKNFLLFSFFFFSLFELSEETDKGGGKKSKICLISKIQLLKKKIVLYAGRPSLFKKVKGKSLFHYPKNFPLLYVRPINNHPFNSKFKT